jgi:FkbM family methyltransferase
MPQGRDSLSFDIISYAGNAEDVVLYRAFRDQSSGFFVDVGAGHPVEGSVTKNLVDRLGWHGVNIEPLPEFADALIQARPRDVTLRVAIAGSTGSCDFFRVVGRDGLVGNGGLSTLDPAVACMHERSGWKIERLTVETVALEEVLAKYASPGFDLLKIDVEGSEGVVLGSADLAKWRPRVIMVEATVPDSPQPSSEWEPLVLSAGYRMTLFDGLNRFYARSDEITLQERLSIPANVFDRWVPMAWARILSVCGQPSR